MGDSAASPMPTTDDRLPEDILFSDLVRILKSQGRSDEDVQHVADAYQYGREHHAGQVRMNGDNYITHPVSVALILAGIPVDTHSLQAAILHDVVEDTDATEEDVEKQFGQEVCKLVVGVTKLGKFKFTSKEEAQAENFRKMFLAMADDIRVILLKLADRLHNMRTLDHMKPEKQVKIATETLEIFAPLANRLGMGNIRAELEDLALRYVHPEEFQAIEKEIAQSQQERNDTIRIVTDRVQRQLYEMGINARIYGRVKNYYSIFKKMRRQQKGLTDIYDLSAVRVIVNSEKECYEVLGVIHHAFTPIPGRFKDYVAMPKSNFYQSLHTTVIGPNGRPLEVQIRTQDMHRIAEYGIAAHWKYKESGGSVAVANEYEQKLSWLKQMVEMQDDAGDAREYVDSVKLDLFQDEVFVFTPKGRVINLPQGSTPVDFAYRIHTEIGNTCAGGIVNGKLVPLNHILKNGDIVEVLTNKKASPKLDWINFVKTHHAKGRIRQWHKKHFKEQHETQGRQLLEAELTRAGLEAHVKSGRLLEVAKELNFGSIEDLFVAVGYGEINPPRVLNRLRKPEPQPGNLDLESLGAERTLINRKPGVLPSQQVARQAPMGDIQGLKGMLYHLAKCCTPVPGESIVGIVTRSRGVMVHRDDCVNIVQSNPERRMKVQWDGAATPETAPQEKGKFNHSVSLEIHVIDRVGVLKDVLTQIADTHTNLSNAKVKKVNHDHTVYLEVSVDVKDIAHLDRVMAAIRKVNDVLAVRRQHHRPNR